MSTTARFAEIAMLAGDSTRAAILDALMDGRALTASELARHAGVTAQTASGHLARLTTAGLLGVAAQGRHRYFRITDADVAHMVEAIMCVAAIREDRARPALRTGPRDAKMRAARTCYDHLAGRLAVALTDGLVAGGLLTILGESAALTPAGAARMVALGVLEAGPRDERGATPADATCRPCLDWSERRWHLAGRFGVRLCRWSLDKGFVRRLEGTRAVAVTPRGRQGFRDSFGFDPA